MTFTQVNARLKNFLMDWLLVLGLKEGMVECATVCVKNWVILMSPLYLYKMTLPVIVVLSPVLTSCPGSLEFHGRQTGDTNESISSSPTP